MRDTGRVSWFNYPWELRLLDPFEHHWWERRLHFLSGLECVVNILCWAWGLEETGAADLDVDVSEDVQLQRAGSSTPCLFLRSPCSSVYFFASMFISLRVGSLWRQ